MANTTAHPPDACPCGERRFRGLLDDRVVRCLHCSLARRRPLPYAGKVESTLCRDAAMAGLDWERLDRTARVPADGFRQSRMGVPPGA